MQIDNIVRHRRTVVLHHSTGGWQSQSLGMRIGEPKWAVLACPVDHARIRAYLAMAERHVAQGERILARQREIVAKLCRGGHLRAAQAASDLLSTFEESQALHVADRDWLLAELAQNRSTAWSDSKADGSPG